MGESRLYTSLKGSAITTSSIVYALAMLHWSGLDLYYNVLFLLTLWLPQQLELHRSTPVCLIMHLKINVYQHLIRYATQFLYNKNFAVFCMRLVVFCDAWLFFASSIIFATTIIITFPGICRLTIWFQNHWKRCVRMFVCVDCYTNTLENLLNNEFFETKPYHINNNSKINIMNTHVRMCK